MLVTLLPLIANILDVRRGGVFQSVREDLVQKILAPSSRCQKGRRGKLLTFKILARIDRSSWSKEDNSGEMQHGAVLSV